MILYVPLRKESAAAADVVPSDLVDEDVNLRDDDVEDVEVLDTA